MFSCEALSNPIMHNSLSAFISILNSWGYRDVSGIVYVRNIYGYIVRHYREFTFRHKNRLNIGSWLAKHRGMFDYPSVYPALNDIFGKKLSFHVYEEVGSVLNHFLKFMGLNLKSDERERSNAGVAPIDIEFYRQANIKSCVHRGLNLSEELKKEYGLLWSEKISEYPSLLTYENIMENFDWKKLKLEFNLSDEQLDLIQENPNRHNDIDVYKLSDLLSFLVENMVKK
ncbi:MAG: hypothetical protein P8H39_12465 [Thalassotalea sp.]|nr:hypothetical protein [Thalassotalea sp.]